MKAKPLQCEISAKSMAKIKVMIQYEVAKPLRDELRQAKKELRELKGKVDYLNQQLMFIEVK